MDLNRAERRRAKHAAKHLPGSRVRQQIESALNLYRSGDAEGAEEIYRHVLASAPADPDANNLLGVIEYERGNLEQASKLMERAVESDPAYVAAQNNLGNVYRDLGHLDKAKRHYEQALALEPGFFQAANNLGILAERQGEFEEARGWYEKALVLAPGSADVLRNLINFEVSRGKDGETAFTILERHFLEQSGDKEVRKTYLRACITGRRFERGIDTFKRVIQSDAISFDVLTDYATLLFHADRPVEAESILLGILQEQPGNVTAYLAIAALYLRMDKASEAIKALMIALGYDNENAEVCYRLGRVFEEQEDYGRAVVWLSKAVELDDTHYDAAKYLAKSLRELEEPEGAEDLYFQLVQELPGDPGVRLELGRLVYAQGRTDEAEQWLRSAIALRPAGAAGYVDLGNIFAARGEKERSLDCYRTGLEKDPRQARIYYSISSQKKYTEDDRGEVREIERRLALRDFPDEDERFVRFALAKAYEDLRDFESSFEHLAKGLELVRATIKDSRLDYGDHFSASRYLTGGTMAQYDGCGHDDETPIFIVGMPRSGTTLLEQILSSHREVSDAGELTYLRRCLDDMCSDDDEVKFPWQAEMHCERLAHYGERYVQHLRKVGGSTRFVTDKMPQNFFFVGMINLMLPKAKIIHIRRDPMATAYSCLKHFFSIGHAYSFDQRELGEYYRQYRKLMEHWRRELPGRMLEVRYEDLVANQEVETRRILDHVGLDWDPSCLQFHKSKRTVQTASLNQVRQPIYRTANAMWRNYERQLKPLIEALHYDTEAGEITDLP